MQKSYILPFSVLAAVPFIMVLGNSMLIPVLPEMRNALNLTQFQSGLIITLFSVPAGVTIPLAGLLSDRVSRRWIIAGALIIYAAGGLIAGLGSVLLKSYRIILAGRVLQGIGAAGTAPIAMALSSDIFTSNERSKVLGMLEASNGMGKVVSPILGSAIGLIAWWAVFFLFPIICVPLALGMLFLVKEPQQKKSPQSLSEYRKDLGKIFKKKGISLIMTFLAGSVVLFVLFGVLFYLSEHLETRYGLDGIVKGLVLAIPVLAMATTSYITGLVTQKRTNLHKALVVLGTGILSGAMFLAAFFIQNTYLMIAALVLAGIGTGMVLPNLNTMITSSCNIDERGMITSLYGGVRFFGVALGPPLFGLLMEKSELIMFIVPAILTAVVGVLNFFFCNAKLLKQKPEQDKGEGSCPSIRQKPRQKPIKARLVWGILFRIIRPKKPLLRPATEIKEDIVEKVVKELEPQIDKALQDELSNQKEKLKEEVSQEIEKYLEDTIEIKEKERK